MLVKSRDNLVGHGFPISYKRGFPQRRGDFWGVPLLRILVFGVYTGGPLFRETTRYACLAPPSQISCKSIYSRRTRRSPNANA